jgi:hypothetical protein
VTTCQIIPLFLAALPSKFITGKTIKFEGAMRKLFTTGTIVIAIALGFSSVTSAEPLAPGKPAGVQAAQLGDKEWLVFGGVALVVAGILVANAGSGDHAAAATQPISVVTTSTS